jgi:hypothetical protein
MPTLPFLDTGELLEGGGTAVPDCGAIPCSVWPATSSRNEEAGRHHDHMGEADLDYVDALQVPNRILVVNGKRYRIVGAEPMDLLPHVVLELNLTSGRS